MLTLFLSHLHGYFLRIKYTASTMILAMLSNAFLELNFYYIYKNRELFRHIFLPNEVRVLLARQFPQASEHIKVMREYRLISSGLLQSIGCLVVLAKASIITPVREAANYVSFKVNLLWRTSVRAIGYVCESLMSFWNTGTLRPQIIPADTCVLIAL